MKSKKLIFTVLFAGILVINTLILSTTNKSDIKLNSLFSLASAVADENGEDGEEQITGKYGKDLYGCSHTFRGAANTTVKFSIEGVELPIELTLDWQGKAEWSCTNCAWQCNLKGVNTSCSDKDCPTFY